MSSAISIKPIFSSTRIIFGLLPGLGALILLRMIIHLYRPDIEDVEHRVKDYAFEELYECYDFIIVGAGSAGAVLANRLTENPNWQVLLLEAGPDENVLSEVPVLFPVLQTSSIDWQFVTEPSDKYCLSMVDTRCKWPRGKVLGGSSVLNAMLYIRGNKRDYDNWASMGNPGWSYDEVLEYFRKSEDMRIPEYQNDPFHSTGGPLSIEYFGYEHPITNKILEAGMQLGYSVVDVNGMFQTGFTRSHATVRDGLRCSTAKAYLRPIASRPNLHISMHSLVERVLIDEYKRAYGVKFTKHSKSHIVRARREVIISAGALQSPQLLMLSGIGDGEHLKDLGIHPIKHLPGVGRNLQDHVAMGGHSFLFDNPNSNGTDYCFDLNTAMGVGNLIDFAVHKEGVLYSMVEAEAMAFVKTKFQDPAEDYPDIQLFIAPTADNLDGGLFGKRANGLNDGTYAVLYEDILYEPSFSIVPLLLRPKSRGYVKLRDTNPFSPPLIYPNYFSEQEDILVISEGARIVQELVNQPALQELNARPNPNRNPGCEKHTLMSDEHLECQARHHSLTIYHPVGTCAMGPEENLEAVVDARLKVHGINNLRVVDGSIMPTIVSGNTNAPIIMIGEKASDMIKEDWSSGNIQEIINCDNNPIIYRAKNFENDEPSRVDLSPKYIPDILNETTNLFSNIPLTPSNVNFNKVKEDANPHLKINNRITPPQNPYSNYDYSTYLDQIRGKSIPYPFPNYYQSTHLDPSGVKNIPYKIPLPYHYHPYPYAYPHPHPFVNEGHTRPLYPCLNYPCREYKNNQNAESTRNMLPSGPTGDNGNRISNSETHGSRTIAKTDRSQKKCKLWFDYDGTRYEVIL